MLFFTLSCSLSLIFFMDPHLLSAHWLCNKWQGWISLLIALLPGRNPLNISNNKKPHFSFHWRMKLPNLPILQWVDYTQIFHPIPIHFTFSLLKARWSGVGRAGWCGEKLMVLFASNMHCYWLSVQSILPYISPPHNKVGLSLLPIHTPGKGVSALKGLAAYGLVASTRQCQRWP